MCVALNTAATTMVVCLGYDVARGADCTQCATGEPVGPRTPERPGVAADTVHILTANLAVAAALLSGVCTLGAFTLVTLLVNAYRLGAGASTLVGTMPEVAGLIWWYAPLELAGFVVVAGVAHHLSAGLLRYLAVGEAQPLGLDLVGLTAAFVLLLAAARVEAEVVTLVALLPGS
jgi:hypothetical protein